MSELEAPPNILGKRTCRKCGQAGTLMVMPLIDDCARHWRLYNNKGIDYAFCIRCAHCGEVAFVTKQTHEDALRRQKYKRCLAMAEMCGAERDKWMMKKANAIGLGKDGVEYYLKARRKCFHYMKWQPRWLKIAAKFKEAKNDQN
jgi:hypothetical protein